MTHHFPQLAAAVAAVPPHGATNSQSFAKCTRAYQLEMLPALLGGTWVDVDTNAYMLLKHLPPLYLLNHHLTFCLRGKRGPATLNNTVFIGLPYNAMSRDGAITNGAHKEAAFFQRKGIVVWLRPDLSAWYPGWTQLVVAARSLFGRDATAFGFTAL